MGNLLQDVRYALRLLFRRPAFTAVAVATLALGVGATTAIFSVVNAVLLKPLPYPQAERLVQVWETNPKRGWTRDTISPQNFADWQAQNNSFDAITAYEYESFIATGGGEPERLVGILASSSFFDVMGVKPARGRTFQAGEDRQGAGRVVVLSDRLWRRRFGGRADALGQAVTLNGESYTVVGVMPPDFSFPTQRIDLWSPSVDLARPRGDHFMFAAARLKPGVTIKQAQEDVDAVARRLGEQYPDSNANSGVALVSLHEETVGKVRPALLVLLGAVALMLLIACVNVANLLLARATARQKELAVRAALGASRLRLARQLLTESLLLALVGGGAGLLLSVWGVALLVKASAGSIPRAAEIGVDARAFLFALAASALTGLLFGLAPALNFSAPDLNRSLKEGTKAAGSPRQSRAQSFLVATEIALALVLLVGAGLLLKSYARLLRVDPGFDAEQVLTARLDLPEAKYPDQDRQLEFARQAVGRIRALPGVESAGAVSDLPFSGSRSARSFEIEGRPTGENTMTPSADYRRATPDYFRAIGIRLVRGRAFTEGDRQGAPPVAVVNETFARRFFPGEEVLGKRVIYGDGKGKKITREIVGVVADVVHDDLTGERAPEVYVPFAQHPQGEMFFAARSAGDPLALTTALRRAVLDVDRDVPVYSVMTMRQRLDVSVAPQRFNALLLAVFAAVAVLLAGVGVFGVMSYAVAQRTHEIGIRMALGAQRRDIRRLVLSRAMRVTLVGVACGLAAALALTRLMTKLLFGVRAADPAIYFAVPAVLAAVALLACYVPARRATRVDPLVALRDE
ncbi:MAG: ABC transporter permease [Acidobacteria bacterium]|nr:ABC transporter permease [Acidobacteriota bacterium]